VLTDFVRVRGTGRANTLRRDWGSKELPAGQAMLPQLLLTAVRVLERNQIDS
jgi:hypothetical protein